MRALVIDDESKARETLRLMLQIYCPHVEVVAEANGGKAALQVLNHDSIDLVFLDINMPEMNGFEFLKEAEHHPFQTIVTTAYDRYALKAIKYSAMDYLLKPIRIDELKSAVAKAASMTNPKDHRLEVFLEHYKDSFYQRLVIPHKGGYTMVNFREILRAQASRNYTRIFLANGEELLSSKTLKEFDELLTPAGFMRVHHSHLINLQLVTSYNKAQGSLELVDGTCIEIARSRKSEFVNRVLLGADKKGPNQTD